MKQIVLIFILSQILLSTGLTQSPPQALLVTHPEFVATGSRSPVENAGMGGLQSDITTNVQEMLTDHTKKLITIGMPEHINTDDNLILGSKYEDPVFVNSKGEEITAQAVAQSHQDLSLEDGELTKIEEDLANAHAENADEAHELIMSKHTEILKFLSTIAKSQKLNDLEEKILKNIKKYLGLLLARHFLIRGQAQESIVQDLQIKIHEITFAIDEHEYVKAGFANKMNPINKRAAHETQNLEAVQIAELAESTLERGPEQLDNSILAVLKVEYVCQRNAKIQQIRYVQDSCLAEVPFRNRDKIAQNLENLKILLDAEAKRFLQIMDNYDAMNTLFKDAINELNDEDEEAVLSLVGEIEEHDDLPDNVLNSLKEVRNAFEGEDPVIAETKLLLAQSQLKSHLDETILSYESTVGQQATLRKATQANVDGASWGESASLDLDDLVEEVLERQSLIKFTPQIETETRDVLDSMRKGQYDFAITKIQNIVSAAKANGYTDILKDKLPVEKTLLDLISDEARRDAERIERLAEQTRGYIASKSYDSAAIRTELLGDILQKRTKLQNIQKTSDQAAKIDDDQEALEELIVQLKTQISAELDNFVAEQEDLKAQKSAIETAENRVVEIEEFADAKQEIDELRHNGALSGKVRESVNRAFNQVILDNRNETRKFLVEAQTRVTEREQELEFAIENLNEQIRIISEALQHAKDEDSEGMIEQFDLLLEEVKKHQNVVSFDNNVVTRVDEIQAHILAQESEEATAKLDQLVGETIGFKEESVIEKHDRLIGDDIDKLQEPAPEGEELTPTQRVVDEIQSDSDAAIETIQALEDGSVSKEAAILEVEQLEAKIQRSEKLDDVKTTNAKLQKGQENNDQDAQIEALGDFKNSISEEQVSLELLVEKLQAIREEIFDAQDLIETSDETNTQLIHTLEDLKHHDGSDAGVKEFLQQAIDSLGLNKRDKAVLDVQSARDHLDRVQNELEISLESIKNQLNFLKDAQDAVRDNDTELLDQHLNSVEVSIDQEQIIYFTDKEARVVRDDAIREIVEGRIEEATQNVEKLTQSAISSLLERVQQVFADGEEQAAVDEDATTAAAVAKEALETPENAEAAQRAVQDSAQAAQKAEKINQIKDARQEVEDNEDVSAIEELIDTVDEEQSALEEEKETLEETKTDLEDTIDDLGESTPEEVAEDLEEVDDQAEEAVDAKTQDAIDSAVEAAEDGDLATAEAELEDAVEGIEDQERDVEQSEELVERQKEKLEEAKEELESGNVEEALDLIDDVQDDTEEQPEIRVDEEIQEAAQEGISAIAEGDVDAAEDAIDEISEGAEEREDEAEEEAEQEAEELAEQEAEEQALPEDEEIEAPEVDVNSLFNTIQQAVEQDDFLRAKELVEEFDAENDHEAEELAQELLESIENEDAETALEILDQLQARVNGTEEPELEDVTPTKKAKRAKKEKKSNLRRHKAMRFSKKQKILRA